MLDQPPTGKDGVDISAIEPRDRCAAPIVLDDGHEIRIYSRDTLYRLGKEYAHNRADYLAGLEKIGYSEKSS